MFSGLKQSLRLYSRSRLDNDGSNLLQALLHHIFTLCRKLRLATLEVLKFKQQHLDHTERWRFTSRLSLGKRLHQLQTEEHSNHRILKNHIMRTDDVRGSQYLVRGSSSTLALPSSQLLWGALLLRHPPDPLLLHFLSAAHTQTEHHPSRPQKRTQEESSMSQLQVRTQNKRIVYIFLANRLLKYFNSISPQSGSITIREIRMVQT